MKIAVLEAGRPPDPLAEEFGTYPAMFSTMLGSDFEIENFDVQRGELPHHQGQHRAYLITGSPAGVYEAHPWIVRLQEFIRTAKNSKMVGICFGHQVMAQALGGHVEKSHRGWGAGLHRYEVVRAEPWIDHPLPVAVPASHQDQVVVQPKSTNIIAASQFTPIAGLAWTDRPAISFQFHPEFSPAFAKALIEKRFDVVPEPEAAIATLDAPNDNARVAGWIRRFLEA